MRYSVPVRTCAGASGNGRPGRDWTPMDKGRVVQISVSRGGVPKLGVREAIVTPLGLEGDACAHLGIHGGPEQALLLVAVEVLEELNRQGYTLFPGALGENLTTAGLNWRWWRAGQRWRVGGEVVIELTRPRRPCRTLDVYGPGIQQAIYDAGVKAGDVHSPRWGMSGFYARVIQGGWIGMGAPVVAADQTS